ncbi:MAG: glycoside hydrolase family 97 catalytic domain-containing protein [Planctomycetia bacterium]|nr:glycoside hydrolase family 97 catalytic domain-containing protein [Planctomycetia bacterium]
MKKLIFGCLSLWFSSVLCAGEVISIVSPEKKTEIQVNVGQSLTYEVKFAGKTVLRPSALGLQFQEQAPYGTMEVLDVTTRTVDERWTNRLSKKSEYRDYCTETTLALREKSAPKRALTLVFRAYDDGLAFRYVLPQQEGGSDFVLTEDGTQFAFAGDWNVWASDHEKFNTSQEKEFPKGKLSEIGKDACVICPLVVEFEGGYAAITEAELTSWAGMQFAAAETANTLRLRLTPRADGNGCVVGKMPAQSPWRILLLGEKPIDLINNSGIILNVSTPCQIADTSWIQPGASSWDWWTASNQVLNTETFQNRVDLAAKMGWKYTTLDDPWYKNSMFQRKEGQVVDTTAGNGNIDLDKAFAYAKEKGIGIILWLHYKDLNTCGREKTFAAYEKWGAAGVKIDFMDSDCQEMVDWIAETTQLGAKHHLLVNFHGMYKPTGLERAWPNQITREGILGNEYGKWSTRVTSRHCATLPFTRFLCGPGDFTPGGFLNAQPEKFRTQSPAMEQGTRAHALALCLITDSPLLTLCDDAKHYENQPGAAFLRGIPSVWEDTCALDGAIGEFLVLARRSGTTFYVSAITNEDPRTLQLSLDFLEEGKTYTAEIYQDVPESAEEATEIRVKSRTVQKGEVLEVPMVRNGGWNAVFHQ